MTTSQHPHRSGQPIKLVTIAKSSSRHFPSTAVARICSFSRQRRVSRSGAEKAGTSTSTTPVASSPATATSWCSPRPMSTSVSTSTPATSSAFPAAAATHQGPTSTSKCTLVITPRRQQLTRCLSWLPPAPRSAHPLNWRARDNSSRRNDSPIPRKVPPCQDQNPTLTPTTAPHPQTRTGHRS